MDILRELKKKIADIDAQTLAMEGRSPTFTVSEIMDLIDSMESAQEINRSETPNSLDTISRQAAIDAIRCDITVTGRQNAELVAATIGTFADRIKALPSARPETLGMICGACDDCDSTVLYLTNPPQVKCKRSGKLHFVTDHCDAPSAQPEERTEERTETHACDCISRQMAIDAVADLYWMDERLLNFKKEIDKVYDKILKLPPAQPEIHEIGYSECSNAMLKMWIDNVLTDGEYSRIMDKLNAHWVERRKK